MGLRFRKRIKILPGLWLNLSKSGISTSIGGKGVTVNLKNGKSKATISIPGTGLSYSENSTGHPANHHLEDQAATQKSTPSWILLLFVVVIALVFLVK